MDGEELRELKEQVHENNKILKKMQARNRLATLGHILKWSIYIAIAVYAYIYLQPFIEEAQNVIEQVKETTSAVGDFRRQADENFSNIIDRFRGE